MIDDENLGVDPTGAECMDARSNALDVSPAPKTAPQCLIYGEMAERSTNSPGANLIDDEVLGVDPAGAERMDARSNALDVSPAPKTARNV